MPKRVVAAHTTLRETLLAGDAAAAEHAFAALTRSGLTLSGVYGRVIEPLLDDVEEDVRIGRLTVAEEQRFGAALREMVAARVASAGIRPGRRGLILLLAHAGAPNALGLVMTQDALQSAGWSVNRPDALPLTSAPAYLTLLGEIELVIVSVHDMAGQAALRRDIRALHDARTNLRVVLTGAAARRSPGFWQQVGADAGGADVETVVSLTVRLTNPLTERELEVLALASRGATNHEIAAGLGVSLSTVKTHFEHMYEKIGVRDRAASVAVALRRGWMP